MNKDIANLFEKNAAVIATAAAADLLEKDAKLFGRFGDEAAQLWADHLNQRVLELSAAVAADDAQLFVARVNWSRTAMRSRHIDAKDLAASLISLQKGIAENMNGEAQALAQRFIQQAVKALDSADADINQTTLDAGIESDRLALKYVQTVVAGNIFPGMQLVLDAVGRGLSIRDAYLRVLLPAQREVGRLWHLNQLSVSEEHLVSHTTYRLMAVLSTRMPRKPDNGYTVIAGAVAGNIHDIGIRAISYLLEFDGWRTIFLGSDIPRAELPGVIQSYEADIVMLSVALSAQIPATQRAVEEIRNSAAADVAIMLGGNGLREQPDLWKTLGADGYAPDALQALQRAEELASR